MKFSNRLKASFVPSCMLFVDLTTGCTNSESSAEKFLFVDWGGTNTDARIKANIEPFEEETGIEVTVVIP